MQARLLAQSKSGLTSRTWRCKHVWGGSSTQQSLLQHVKLFGQLQELALDTLRRVHWKRPQQVRADLHYSHRQACCHFAAVNDARAPCVAQTLVVVCITLHSQ